MSVKYAILGLLNYKDMHGYRIRENIERDFGHMWSINHGQIYQNLRSLEQEGLVELVEISPSENGGPHKKSYRITDEGREEFLDWLGRSPERQMILRDPFLTRFVFFGFGDPDKAVELIDEQIELYARQLDERRDNLPRRRGKGDCVRLASELGVEFNEMYLAWLRRARDELSGAPRRGRVGT